MSVFSEKFGQFAREKDMKMYQVAQRSGLDRSTAYKLLRGERLPAGLETVSRLAGALQLDPTQTEELITAYKITRMGDDNYLRRKKVLDFLNSFSDSKPSAPAVLELSAKEKAPLAECGVCEGEEQVNHLVYTVVGSALTRKDCRLMLMVQPEYRFLFQMLLAVAPSEDCAIRHILCLENTNSPGAAPYNMDCLKTVTDMLVSRHNYMPFYYYDNINSHFRNHMLLPYLILTDSCTVQISYDLQHAVYFTEPEKIIFFEGLFDSAMKRSTLLAKSLESIPESIEFYLAQYARGPAQSGCNVEPCLIPYLDRRMLEKYTKQIDRRTEILDLFFHYVSLQREVMYTDKFVEYFTAEGLEYFCCTGHIWQLPAFAVEPLEPADRYELLRRYCVSRTDTKTFLLKKEAALLLGKLEVMAWRDGRISFVYEHTPDRYTSFYLLESSLSFCFADFFTYLYESDMAYDNEESIRRIREAMKKIKTT